MNSNIGHALKSAAFLVGWGVCLFAVLQVRLLPSSWLGGHGICGPWGCGPPATALVAWHGFWTTLLIWPAAWLRWKAPAIAWRIGLAGVAIGLLGFVGIVSYEAATYLPSIAEGAPSYFVRRCLFALATMVDVPILPVLLVGTILTCLPPRRRNDADEQVVSPTPEPIATA